MNKICIISNTIQEEWYSDIMNDISLPEYQRILDNDSKQRIEEMVTDQCEYYSKNKMVCFPGVIHIARVPKNKYELIDGQHRFFAMKELYQKIKVDFKVGIHKWTLGTKNDIRQLMQVVNNQKSLMCYELMCDADDKKKIDALRKYIEEHYSLFMSKSKLPQRPNINYDAMIERLLNEDTLTRFNLLTNNQLIGFFETHNKLLKEKWKHSKDKRYSAPLMKCTEHDFFIGMDREYAFLHDDVQINITLVKTNIYVHGRKNIPSSVRMSVWDNNIPGNVRVGNCYVCSSEIKFENFHCGHIVSVKDNGTNNITNMKPICVPCNTSMGAKNMDEFKREYYGSL